MQLPLLQLPPGQYFPQCCEMDEHQLENSKQFKLSGKPACKKQEATCTLQEEKAVQQESESVNAGIGLEHQFPHEYSQVGVGVVVYVEVQRDAVVFVEVVDVVGGDVVDTMLVVEDVLEVLLVVGGLDVLDEVVLLLELLLVVVTTLDVLELEEDEEEEEELLLLLEEKVEEVELSVGDEVLEELLLLVEEVEETELDEEIVDDVLLKVPVCVDEVLLLEELVDEMLVMTGDEVLDVELVLETVKLVTVELVEGLGGSAAQGWLDSKSVAT